MLGQNRTKILDLKAEFDDRIAENARLITGFNQKICDQDERNQCVRQQLLCEMEAKRHQHASEIAKANAELQRIRSDFERKRTQMSESAQSGNERAGATLEQLRISLRDNRASLEISVANHQKEKLSKIEQIKCSLKNQAAKSDLTQLEHELERRRSSGADEFRKLSEMHSTEIQSRKKMYEEQIRAKKADLANLLGSRSATIASQNAILEHLKCDRDQLRHSHASESTDLSNSCDGEIAALAESQKREIEQIEADYAQSLQKASEENQRQIAAVQSNHLSIAAQLRTKLSTTYTETMKKIADSDDSMSYNAMKQKYQKEFDDLQKLLGTEVPFVPGDFRSLTSIHNNLSKEFEDRKSRVNNQRSLTLYDWSRAVENENERAARAAIPRSSSRARDQVKQSLTVQISDCIASTKQKECELLAALDALRPTRVPEFAAGDDFDPKELRNEFENLIASSNKSVQSLLDVKNGEISAARAEFERENRDYATQMSKNEDFIQMEVNFYARTRSELDKVLRDNQDQNASEIATIDSGFRGQVGELKCSHGNCVRQYTQKCEDQRYSSKRARDSFEIDSRGNEALYARKLTEYEELCKGNLAKLAEEKQARIDLLEEKLSNLANALLKLKRGGQFNPKVGRPEEIEMIERLQAMLHTKKIQFGNAVKDLCQYKHMYIDQEKQINTNFAGMPDIGLLQTSSPPVGILA
jgi:hypothetical protein